MIYSGLSTRFYAGSENSVDVVHKKDRVKWVKELTAMELKDL
jgi:hypothetical protein